MLYEVITETQCADSDPQVAVEISGSLEGEIVINLPQNTLNKRNNFV